jgi:ribosomal protein S18 acetylase RimI-like enzyme
MPRPTLSTIGDIALRPATAGDEALLWRIYASTREEELAAAGWPSQRKAAFLHGQFVAQQRHFRQHFPGAHNLLMERDGQPVGRLCWQWMPKELRLVDISLLPPWRGQGLGRQVVSALQALAAGEGQAMGLHVEVGNRAISLYERLGFVVTGHAGLHHRMRWPDPGACVNQ